MVIQIRAGGSLGVVGQGKAQSRRAASQARPDRDGEADRGEAGRHVNGVNLAHFPPQSVAVVAHVSAEPRCKRCSSIF